MGLVAYRITAGRHLGLGFEGLRVLGFRVEEFIAGCVLCGALLWLGSACLRHGGILVRKSW